MDLVGTFTALQQSRLAENVQISVARKALDAQRQQGAAALQLLQAASPTPTAGDSLAAKATGLGSQLDTYA